MFVWDCVRERVLEYATTYAASVGGREVPRGDLLTIQTGGVLAKERSDSTDELDS